MIIFIVVKILWIYFVILFIKFPRIQKIWSLGRRILHLVLT